MLQLTSVNKFQVYKITFVMLLFYLINVYNSIKDIGKMSTVPPQQAFQVLMCYTVVINYFLLHWLPRNSNPLFLLLIQHLGAKHQSPKFHRFFKNNYTEPLKREKVSLPFLVAKRVSSHSCYRALHHRSQCGRHMLSSLLQDSTS